MNWAAKEKRYRYKTQDPLFMDYDKLYLNQGVYPYIEKAKAVGRGIPINKRAYILYHMAKQNVYDPDFVIHMEQGLLIERSITDLGDEGDNRGEKDLTARYAFGAVCSYWRMNYGTAYGLKYWETYMLNQAQDLHIADVIELSNAFRENRTHHREHFKAMLRNQLK